LVWINWKILGILENMLSGRPTCIARPTPMLGLARGHRHYRLESAQNQPGGNSSNVNQCARPSAAVRPRRYGRVAAGPIATAPPHVLPLHVHALLIPARVQCWGKVPLLFSASQLHLTLYPLRWVLTEPRRSAASSHRALPSSGVIIAPKVRRLRAPNLWSWSLLQDLPPTAPAMSAPRYWPVPLVTPQPRRHRHELHLVTTRLTYPSDNSSDPLSGPSSMIPFFKLSSSSLTWFRWAPYLSGPKINLSRPLGPPSPLSDSPCHRQEPDAAGRHCPCAMSTSPILWAASPGTAGMCHGLG
jgi:hypothetical protein